MTTPLARGVGVGLELEDVGLQQDHLEQLVDVEALLRRDVHEDVGAAPLLGHDLVLGEHLADLVGIRAVLVDLVDGDDDRHAGGLGVVDGLDGLRHDAVVGGDDEHDDVGGVGAAGTHGGERLVARGVDEGDLLAVVRDHGRTDVLRDAAGLGRRDAGLTDGVEQRRLAVVDVTHDGDDRRTRLEVLGLVVEDELPRPPLPARR